MRENLFAFDCGSTNWRLYRVSYDMENQTVRMLGDPQPAPLTSFIERRLPTVMLLSPDGLQLESFGEAAYQYLYDEQLRENIRSFFKPCIGSHLERRPLPHQTRYTHAQALKYTEMLLQATLEQLRVEKWRSRPFDETLRFSFSYPVYWQEEHGSKIFDEFKQIVHRSFPDYFDTQISFVTEPEAAILSLQHQGFLDRSTGVVLLIDCGGSTTDLTAGQLTPQGELTATYRYGEPHGGGLYDEALALYMAERLKIPQTELDDDPNALHLLRMFARQLKEGLSRQLLNPNRTDRPPQRAITLVTQKGQVYRRTIRLDEDVFTKICRHLITDFEYLIDNALQAMHLQEEDVSQVALVGGGSQLFSIIRYLRQRFGDHNVILADNPSETVVHGLALAYGYTFGNTQPWGNSSNVRLAKRSTRPLPYHKKAEPLPLPQPSPTYIVDEDNDAPTVLENPPEQSSPWQLISDNEQTYVLDSPLITIGRKRINEVVVFDDQASRAHAQIRNTPTGYEIIDLNSSNGTYVNGIRLQPKKAHFLNPNDQILIGRTKFTVVN